MYWKMSIDLSSPLVPSMGQHDPLDGLITYLQLQATAPLDAALAGLHAYTGQDARQLPVDFRSPIIRLVVVVREEALVRIE